MIVNNQYSDHEMIREDIVLFSVFMVEAYANIHSFVKYSG